MTEFFWNLTENIISEQSLRDNTIGIAIGTYKDKTVNDNIVTGNGIRINLGAQILAIICCRDNTMKKIWKFTDAYFEESAGIAWRKPLRV